jgi:DeoD family purine-nucleoside phosphorylase
VDVAISGSLKSPGVDHSEPVQQAENESIVDRRNDSMRPTRQSQGNTIHLHPTAALAERVLLPGDPGRALALAQFLLESPLMFNHNRGLWGYTGMANDGEQLTIQSTGMGGPSAAIVLHELISLGVTRAIRVGTCGALDPELSLGDLVIARESITADGTSAALGVEHLAYADPALTNALAQEADRRAERSHHEGRIVSTDLFYERDSTRNASWSAKGALAVEMEAATLFAVGANAGIQVACILAVSDTFDGPDARTRIDDDALRQAAEAMGSAAAAALGARAPTSP